MSNHPKVSVMYEVDATKMLIGKNPNWNFLSQKSMFAHQDRCEFILFTGWPRQSEIAQMLSEMRSFGCSEDFVKAVNIAIDSGVRWTLFYTV